MEKTHPADSFDDFVASIARNLGPDLLRSESGSQFVGSIDRIMFSEARAGELRLAYLRCVVVAPYLAITLWTLLRRPGGTSASQLAPAVVLGSVWLAGAIALAFGLRRGWYGRWLPHAAPLLDAAMILFLLAAFMSGMDAGDQRAVSRYQGLKIHLYSLN